MLSGTESRTVEASEFGASRRIWREETDTGPYADPMRWIGGTTAEDDEGREG